VEARLAAGQAAEVRSRIDLLLAACGLRMRWPVRRACDCRYSAGWVRRLRRLCGMKAMIPDRKNEGGAKRRGGG